jgi:hypothetical protein
VGRFSAGDGVVGSVREAGGERLARCFCATVVLIVLNVLNLAY